VLRLLSRVKRKTGLLRCKYCQDIIEALRDKRGIEIGGPSQVFDRRGLIPVYPVIRALDTSNYSEHTVWCDGSVKFIHEATDLFSVRDGEYVFVLASHVLEHVANPLKALTEWRRILKPSGILLMLLPFKKYTFDHRRPFTTFEHLVEDFSRDTPEGDLTHLNEILELHDLSRDPPAGTPEQFKQRCMENLQNRCMHQHVFDPNLVSRLYQHTGFRLINLSIEFPFHIVALGRRLD